MKKYERHVIEIGDSIPAELGHKGGGLIDFIPLREGTRGLRVFKEDTLDTKFSLISIIESDQVSSIVKELVLHSNLSLDSRQILPNIHGIGVFLPNDNEKSSYIPYDANHYDLDSINTVIDTAISLKKRGRKIRLFTLVDRVSLGKSSDGEYREPLDLLIATNLSPYEAGIVMGLEYKIECLKAGIWNDDYSETKVPFLINGSGKAVSIDENALHTLRNSASEKQYEFFYENLISTYEDRLLLELRSASGVTPTLQEMPSYAELAALEIDLSNNYASLKEKLDQIGTQSLIEEQIEAKKTEITQTKLYNKLCSRITDPTATVESARQTVRSLRDQSTSKNSNLSQQELLKNLQQAEEQLEILEDTRILDRIVTPDPS